MFKAQKAYAATKKIVVEVPTDWVEELDEECERAKISRPALVTQMIRYALDNREVEPIEVEPDD
jgi:metal-responsive CopG/Arc/MetJ family transcriptional regulator